MDGPVGGANPDHGRALFRGQGVECTQHSLELGGFTHTGIALDGDELVVALQDQASGLCLARG